MQSMDDILFKLATEKRISAEDAFHKATSKAKFEALLEEPEEGAPIVRCRDRGP